MEALGPSAPLSCLISIMNANVQWLVLCRVMDCRHASDIVHRRGGWLMMDASMPQSLMEYIYSVSARPCLG